MRETKTKWTMTCIALSGLLASLPTFAGGVSNARIAECLDHSAHFGEGNKTHNQGLPLCYSDISSIAQPRAIRQSSDGSVQVVAYGSMIFTRIQTPTPQASPSPSASSSAGNNPGYTLKVISGKQSGLQDVRAIALNEAEHLVYALNYVTDKEGDAPMPEIDTFDWKLGGNISPLRRAVSPDLKGATSLAFEPVNGQLLVAIPDQRAILRLSGKANVDGLRAENSSVTIAWIRGGNTLMQHPVELAFNPDRNEILVGDDAGQQVISFDASATGDAAPRLLFQGEASSPIHPASISYDSSTKMLEVHDLSGAVSRFNCPKNS